MNKPAVTDADYDRLSALAQAVRRSSRSECGLTLAARLRNALVFRDEEIAGRFVRMNTLVWIRDSESGESYRYRLVFPVEADSVQGKISVLTPLGSALLGRREGESFEYESPGGVVRVQVERVEDEC